MTEGMAADTLRQAWAALDDRQRWLLTRSIPALAWLPGGEGLAAETHYAGFVEARTGLRRDESGALILASLRQLAEAAGVSGEPGIGTLLVSAGVGPEDAADWAAAASGSPAPQ